MLVAGAVTALFALFATIAPLPIFGTLEFDAPARKAPARPPAASRTLAPTPAGLADAREFSATRAGLVSFAAIDSRGHLRGHHADRLYPAASTVKAMVLAAELRRLAAAGGPIDRTTRSLLSSMVRYSDNEATDAIYARVGDVALLDIARRAGMSGFRAAGHWGNAQIAAADAARLFGALDRVLPRRHRRFGQRLLGSIVASQSWGIPVAAGNEWAARFKGGWLPGRALVHQAAELRERGGPRVIALAVLTDEQPSFGYGVATVRGIADRLLRDASWVGR